VSDEEFGAALKAGWSDANIIDIIVLTSQWLLTNFLDNPVQTPIDFPAVPINKPKTA
jgi:alkylhydroperoxidase family enzyme